jgi:hypothetical protein
MHDNHLQMGCNTTGRKILRDKMNVTESESNRNWFKITLIIKEDCGFYKEKMKQSIAM